MQATSRTRLNVHNDHEALIIRGKRYCRAITKEYAKSFYFASHCLPRELRQHAYTIYGFCRWADNAVDQARDPDDSQRRLNQVRSALSLAYSSRGATAGILAFRRTVCDRQIPEEYFRDLLDGMAMDLTVNSYETFEDLDQYCYRVAGVVGLMMTRVFGYRHERCFQNAIALGRGMQLTNILRDIREDLKLGRIYLPAEDLRASGVTREQLQDGRVDGSFRRLMRFQINRARAAYREAEQGIDDLLGSSSRLTVRVMSRVYGAILDEIELLDFDVFRHRARVSSSRKLRLLALCQVHSWRDDLRLAWH